MMYKSKHRALPLLFSSTRNLQPTRALLQAARSQDTEGVVQALDSGADVNAWDDKGDTALHMAVYASNDDMISVLTDHPDININKGDDFGKTPLYVAVDIRAKETVKDLLDAGANPNEGDIFAKTPLHVATFIGRVDIVKILIMNGADVNAQDHCGERPLTMAVLTSPNPTMARLLLRYGANIDINNGIGQGLLTQAIYNCSCSNDRDSVAFLIRRGADVNFIEKVSQWTPLHAAAFANDAHLIGMLIDAGADLHYRDSSGMTPLDIAVLVENMTAARELKKYYPPDEEAIAEHFHGEQYYSPNFLYL